MLHRTSIPFLSPVDILLVALTNPHSHGLSPVDGLDDSLVTSDFVHVGIMRDFEVPAQVFGPDNREY
jgi:hypothetical protein